MNDPIPAEWEELKRRCEAAAETNGGKVPADLVAECLALVGRAINSLDTHATNRSS